MRQIDLVRKELLLWGKLDHRNIVKIFRLYENDREDKMYVWMQYADLGQIADYDTSTQTFVMRQSVKDCIAAKVGSDLEQQVRFIFKGVA